MRVVGVGFPEAVPVPTAVTLCGDGVHVVNDPRRGRRKRCACRELYLEPNVLLAGPLPHRVIIADQEMDDVEPGGTKDFRFSDGTVRWAS